MTNEKYKQQELFRHLNFLKDLQRAPLAERKAARADYRERLLEPVCLARATEHLISGDYGEGSYLAVQNVLGSRCNLAPIFSQLIAAYDDHCPAREATAAFKSLTEPEQQAATEAIETAIKETLAALED